MRPTADIKEKYERQKAPKFHLFFDDTKFTQVIEVQEDKNGNTAASLYKEKGTIKL